MAKSLKATGNIDIELYVEYGNVWHLNDSKCFYLGRLRQANGKWVFDATPKTQELAEMADFFGDYLTAWLE
jgi:hypothetical protein